MLVDEKSRLHVLTIWTAEVLDTCSMIHGPKTQNSENTFKRDYMMECIIIIMNIIMSLNRK